VFHHGCSFDRNGLPIALSTAVLFSDRTITAQPNVTTITIHLMDLMKGENRNITEPNDFHKSDPKTTFRHVPKKLFITGKLFQDIIQNVSAIFAEPDKSPFHIDTTSIRRSSSSDYVSTTVSCSSAASSPLRDSTQHEHIPSVEHHSDMLSHVR